MLVTNDDLENHLLVIETDKSESEVRTILEKEGYKNTNLLKLNKTNQLGNVLVKKINDWQIYTRLYKHKDHIQLDVEVKLSDNYVGDTTYGWITGFQESWNIISKNFGNVWIYHKGNKKYVKKIISETSLTLNPSQSKTDYKLLMVSGILGAIIGAGLVWGFKKYTENKS